MLNAQARAVPGVLRGVRYASYAQAQAGCARLAAQLTEHVGVERLRECRFIGVPRGGLFVLGMLSYLLGLRPEQLRGAVTEQDTVVLVDDCAYSGQRIDPLLRALPTRNVTLALLYAPVPLAGSLRAAFPHLTDVLVARELAVLTEGRTGSPDDLPEPAGTRHWWGRAEHVGFPWTEPERVVWSPPDAAWVGAWPLFPPELCLKRAGARGTAQVQLQPTGAGPLRPAEPVLFGEMDGTVVLADTDSGGTLALEGVSAGIWHALVRRGTREGIVEELLRQYDVSEAELRADVDATLEELVRRGLLVGDV